MAPLLGIGGLRVCGRDFDSLSADTLGQSRRRGNKKSGRKSKLTAELIERICEYICKGNYISTACQIVGIHKATYYNWLEQGETDIEAGIGSMYADFLKAVTTAEAEAEEVMVAVVREVATQKKEWLPAMTYLERRHPERWGRKDRHQVDVNATRNINITRVEVVMPHGEGHVEIQEQPPQAVEGEARELLEDGEDRQENS